MIGIINCGSMWLEEIKCIITESNYTFKIIEMSELERCNLGIFSGIIISGGPTLLTQVDLEPYRRRFKFLKSINIPVLGICLGHQLMGIIYGSEIHAGKPIDKMHPIGIVKSNELFNNIENQALFRENHSEFITLPPEFDLLAKSKTYDNEAMKHKHKPLYGMQFHPEKSDRNGKQLFKNFLKICS